MSIQKHRGFLEVTGLVLIFLLRYPLAPLADSGYTFYIYGFASDSTSVKLRQVLSSLSEKISIVFHDLYQERNGKRYSEIYSFINMKCNIPILGKDIERRISPPLLHLHNLLRYYQSYLLPLTGMFYNDRLVAVIISQSWFGENFWSNLISNATTWQSVHVFTISGKHIIKNETLAGELQELFSSGRITAYEALPLILRSALKDSLNPPTFTLTVAMLLISLYTFDKRKKPLTSLCFTSAVYLASFLLGLGLITPMAVPYTKQVIAILTLFVAAKCIIKGLGNRFRLLLPVKEVPNPPAQHPRAEGYLTSLTASIVGLIATVMLLSPNSGPYLLGLTTLSEVREGSYRYPLLGLYCLIFTVPLLVVSVILCLSAVEKEKNETAEDMKFDLAELIEGIILAAISLYVLIAP